MNLRKKIIKWRRDRVRDEILRVGIRLREKEALRSSISPTLWPHEVEYLTQDIRVLERRRERLLNFIRKTA